MILIIFNNFLLNLLYKTKEILINNRGLRPTILVKNKIDLEFKTNLSIKNLIDKHKYIYFKIIDERRRTNKEFLYCDY